MATLIGKVESIHIASRPAEPTQAILEVRAVLGRGLEGDRNCGADASAPGKPHRPDREVTLVESEALEALHRDCHVELSPGESRRNIVTRGVALNHLVGREFHVGEVVLRGIRLCEPCDHLEKLTRAGVRQGLIHRGGLRAQIVRAGLIRVGDAVRMAAD